MKLETANAIKHAANMLSIDGVEVYEGYSGRGMCGSRTTGLTAGSISDLMKAVAWAAGGIVTDANDSEELTNFVEDLPTRQDNMGRDIIVY
jgi:hypothetical protein